MHTVSPPGVTRGPRLTMVPDLRMAVKLGAYSMSNEIRAHLEATGPGYFTAGSAQNIGWHVREGMCVSVQHACIDSVSF